MSATECVHSSKPTPVDPSFNGLQSLLPESFVPSSTSRVTLRGKNGDVHAPNINIGAWSWGDTATWHWKPEERSSVREAWKVLLENGINWIDTAQAYGSGESERICAELFEGLPREKTRHPDQVAPAKMLKESLERMKLDYLDVYIVRGHIHASSITQVAKGLAECVNSGMTKTVGVANYSVEDMIQMADELAKYDIPLTTNQCEFNILRRYPETHGLIKACRDRGIIFQSYSSLAQGRLSGKYTTSNPAPKTYRFSSYDMKDLEPTLDVLSTIAKKRRTNCSAVALNYNMSKGAVPTVGVRSLGQAQQISAALGWRLSEDEISRIDKVSMEGKSTVLWQQG